MDENYKYLDIQRILHYLQQHKEGVTVDAILQYSGADKFRVYPALFELEQEGRLEVLEREELGAPTKVRLRKLRIGNGHDRYVSGCFCKKTVAESGRGLEINLYLCKNQKENEMKTLIANPIYDSVFKFLMEDERAAKVLLSALLKQEVRDLKMRRNEYTNLSQTRISLFRIDFSARIKDISGKEQLVLIELQKTWLMTETLRFRQYLGTQYLNVTSWGISWVT